MFSNVGMSYEATWNTLQAAFTWRDALSSQAATFSVTVAIISLVFPFRAVAKHSFRACWQREGKGIDREYSLLDPLNRI